MINVCMLPTVETAQTDDSNAIHQIVIRLSKLLPNYGVQLTPDAGQADLIIGHAGQTAGVHKVDVTHCHGLYPTAQAELVLDWHHAANRQVIENLTRAKRITVPSQWVADILRRDMHVNPDVVGWAVDFPEWQDAADQGYVLWNKTRSEGICTPKPMQELARLRPNQQFVSTFGDTSGNVRVIGRQPFDKMKGFVKGAAVYLATTKETFGIGTLEAMACGIPILGYRWGGTADLVQHGRTGYLAIPGDVEDLAEGLDYCLKYRDVLGHNARKEASLWTWDTVAEKFAAIYYEVLERRHPCKVSVVIPCHNYAKFVGDALASVFSQKVNYEYEVITVIDRSTDDSERAVSDACTDRIGAKTYVTDFGNPADARNYGISKAVGEYVVCLDADDRLGNQNYLQVLSDALDADRRLGIAFTRLQIINAAGEYGGETDWPNGYDYEQQLLGRNQVPTCCMFRREAWERTGGYRSRYIPGEDAEFWLRIGSIGYHGKQVTSERWFEYRVHGDSLTAGLRNGNGRETNWHDKSWIVTGKRPLACDGKFNRPSWPVRNYDVPIVSIVIPVAPAHVELLKEALDSVENQTELNWECIVVNDCGYDITPGLKAYPWVRVVNGGCLGGRAC